MHATWEVLAASHVMTLPDKYGSGASARNIWLSISHIPGEINAIADQASRVFDDSTEWKLNVDVFNRIVTSLTTPTVDMFASRFNYQLTPYVSWPPDPQAMAIAAFTLDLD